MVIESAHLLASFLAIGAAISNALSQLFLRIGTENGKTSDAIFIVMVINLIVLAPPILLLYYPTYNLTSVSLVSFIAAGVLGTLLGRAFMYTSISKIGASRTSPIVATQAMVATVLGVLLLSETLSVAHFLGITLTVIGVAAIAWETSHDNPGNLSPRELAIGLLIPFGAAVAYGAEPIYASFGFEEGTAAPVGLVIKTVAATLGFGLYLRFRNILPRPSTIRTNNVQLFVLAGIFNTLFLLGYYVALEIAPVSVVVPLHITSSLFVIVFSYLFMPERLEHITWKLAASAVVVVGGVALIIVFGNGTV